MHNTTDLRSDTVTRPSAAMRQAMASAEVGDDVFDDDPTVHALQDRAAELMGKEAALLVPSGTMSNAIAIRCHTQPGDEVLLDESAHSMLYELGLPATLAQVLTRQFTSRAGIPDVGRIEAGIHPGSLHAPRTALIILENTHNRAGGAIIPLDVHRQVWEIAQGEDLRVHIDGARIFNASAATRTPPAAYAGYADTITFCLSKGLGCPVGSVLCGPWEFIERARRVRKMLGGGMRQAGILAAAGLYALSHNVERLAEDHARARKLANGIGSVPGVTLDDAEPPTNMVYFQTAAPSERIVEALKARHVLCNATAPHRIRMVTHLDVDDDDIDRAVTAIRDA